ncbi:hypothetical protein V7S43_001354 [Phytophthora oleae]|uniref:Uncharacterized protein n=1 Tax=Phytophthora oleae TaxID=2107226 RepID=A0ABD3G6L5_9STRA
MEQHASDAHAFFQAHKDLFQYDKYVASQDPFQAENSHVHTESGAAMTSAFLEHYCQLDRERPPVPAVSELRLSLLHPPTRRFSMSNASPYKTTAPLPVPAFVTLQSASILENLQHDPIRSYTFERQQHTTQHTQQQPALSITNSHNSPVAPQYPSPVRDFTSKAIADPFFSSQQQRSPVRQSLQSVPKAFSFPQLSGLLIDRETRAAESAHKSWDEAHKIEVLIGSKCVGRVSAASRNIPPSIRSRLQASANVSVRRERLYDLLRREYEELSKRNTQ